MTTFQEFLSDRETASTAFVEGDVGPLLAMSVTADPATIYPPTGAVAQGAQQVNDGNTHGAASFSPGADNRFEILHSGSSEDLGYWTGVQRSRVLMGQDAAPREMNLRVTELFRRDGDQWLLFHRHADLLQE